MALIAANKIVIIFSILRGGSKLTKLRMGFEGFDHKYSTPTFSVSNLGQN